MPKTRRERPRQTIHTGPIVFAEYSLRRFVSCTPDDDLPRQLTLAPVTGPGRPTWEFKPFKFAAGRNDKQESMQEAINSIPRAPPRGMEDDACETAFMPSDGVVITTESEGGSLDLHGSVATHKWHANERTCVLSRNRVFDDAEGGRRTWRARATVATCKDMDIFFGVTEAARFDEVNARAVVFDVQGNCMMGWSPLNMPVVYTVDEVAMHMATVKDGANNGQDARHKEVTVTADLEKKLLTVTVSEGVTVEYTLTGWKECCLCVSFKCRGDQIKLCAEG